ncbi:MAG: flagellar basal body P-ring protein FlgI [Bacteriovoracales bacterium]|nr:flagellar basal body P-ring protein FlgI [Bacteriovoracales bacterium]
MTFFKVFIPIMLICHTYGARIKDVSSVKGVRENPLIGYGLVIGLNGTGDGGGEVTNLSLIRMFQNMGLDLKKEITSSNVASVVVTAKLHPFARIGQKIDVTISSIASASSLAGGTLLITPLKGGDGKVYAIASGSVSLGGLDSGSKQGATAFIPNGALVEKEVVSKFNNKKSIRLSLHHSDFTTAARIQKIINENLGGKFSVASDATTIDITVPPHYYRKIVPLISIIENFEVNPSKKARIVINERTGTIVAGGDILLRNVAIGHGNLNIEIKNEDGKQGGKKENFYLMKKNKTNLSDLVKALNELGAKPNDIISIFQALKSNGAITGEIEII